MKHVDVRIHICYFLLKVYYDRKTKLILKYKMIIKRCKFKTYENQLKSFIDLQMGITISWTHRTQLWFISKRMLTRNTLLLFYLSIWSNIWDDYTYSTSQFSLCVTFKSVSKTSFSSILAKVRLIIVFIRLCWEFCNWKLFY